MFWGSWRKEELHGPFQGSGKWNIRTSFWVGVFLAWSDDFFCADCDHCWLQHFILMLVSWGEWFQEIASEPQTKVSAETILLCKCFQSVWVELRVVVSENYNHETCLWYCRKASLTDFELLHNWASTADWNILSSYYRAEESDSKKQQVSHKLRWVQKWTFCANVLNQFEFNYYL